MSTKKRIRIHRDISWMYFNNRVLLQAINPETPLIERLRFLGIYSNNLDEFYRVRVAGLRRWLVAKSQYKTYYKDDPEKVLKQIKKLTNEQQVIFENCYNDIKQELEKNKIRFVDEKNLNDKQIEYVKEFFRTKLYNSLNLVIINQKSKLPSLTDTAIYLMISFKSHSKRHIALIRVPADEFSRFFIMSGKNGTTDIILLEDVIRFCLPELFSSLNASDFESYTIKFTRDAEMDLKQEVSGDLSEKLVRALRERKKGAPLRLVYDRELPKNMLKLIRNILGLNSSDTLTPGGRYHNFKDFMGVPDLGQPKLIFKKQPPCTIPEIENSPNMMELITKKDLLIHCPYQDFSYFIRLLKEAAIDPGVKEIKMTVYRLAQNSRIVRALINAAMNGKKVTVVVELLARFNEAENIEWSRKMQDVGIKVLYGVEGLKVHTKLLHISRKGKNIACVSTGNFHEGNARVYTDIILMTNDSRIVLEVNKVFDLINKPLEQPKFNNLLVSPINMRKRLNEMFNKEIKHAREGKPAYIYCKINHITDFSIVDKIYQAAEAGVKIKLLVRGNCSLVSSKNIELKGIVDRYLEHPRFFIFGDQGKEQCFISSADWMPRNLDYRIETAVPIYDTKLIEQLRLIIEYGLKDNMNAYILDGKSAGKLSERKEGESIFRSQEKIYDIYKSIESNSKSS